MHHCTPSLVTTREELASLLNETSRPRVLVPTMGALHRGHAALLETGRQLAGDGGTLVASIFVNPTQFGPGEDFDAYPRSLEADLETCAAAGVDVVFCPTREEIYPTGLSTTSVSEASLSQGLCGASRPGHFDGVCTVVLKLLNLIAPDTAIFGKKDYQQLAVLRRMVADLDVPVKIVGAETVRQSDGLALSSRNTYLTPDQRTQATALRRGLLAAHALHRAGDPTASDLVDRVRATLATDAPDARVDYLELVDCGSLAPIAPASPIPDHALIAAAVFFGKTRLIDNIELDR